MIEITVPNKKGKPVKLRTLYVGSWYPIREMFHNGKWRALRQNTRYISYLKAAELISNE